MRAAGLWRVDAGKAVGRGLEPEPPTPVDRIAVDGARRGLVRDERGQEEDAGESAEQDRRSGAFVCHAGRTDGAIRSGDEGCGQQIAERDMNGRRTDVISVCPFLCPRVLRSSR